jgi:hypothetical protein
MDININSQILVYNDLASFPVTGAAKTFYVADDTEKLYRWTGSAYVEVSTSGGVPYTGATSDVDLGEYELKAGQVEFDQTPTGTAGVAVMRWNNTDGTLDLGLKGGNVTLQVGQEQVLRVVNKTGSPITNGQVVRVVAVAGGVTGVALAQADSEANSETTIGIATEDIADNAQGFITSQGLVHDVNTNSFNEGDVLYLSPITAGGITNIKPVAPQHMVIVGYVAKKGIADGHILVKVDNGYELEELHNVTSTNYTTPIDTDSVLTYDVTNSIWKRLTLANLRTDVLDGFNTVNLIRQEFTYTSGAQTFTLSNSASAVYSVFVNGQELRQSQYTVVTTTLTIVDTLEASDRVDVIYSNATLGINPSYTKAETDTLLNAKVTSNSAITGATKTKITYDAKGLVTSGADATTADIAASTNKNYVTDAQAIVIGNTSGTNSGDVSVTDGSTIDFTLTGQALTAEVKDSSITEAKQLLADNTTNDVSTSKHGYAPKLPNDATKFLRGDGAYASPSVSLSVQSVTSSATVTPTSDNDLVVITAQAAALTMAIPSGTPVQGQALMIRIKDNATARLITWTGGAGGYRAIGVTLPTTTVISKTTYVGFIYNSTDSKWDAIGVTTEA